MKDEAKNTSETRIILYPSSLSLQPSSLPKNSSEFFGLRII
jgi:hypothetical protein